MSYDVYRYIFIGAAILFGAMLLVAILLFFLLKIPKIISDLTGATARKAIKNIREQNEGNSGVTYAGSTYNKARGKVTDRMTQSGNVVRNGSPNNMNINTAKIAVQPMGVPQGGNENTLLEQPVSNETTLLEQPVGNETTLLDSFNTTQSLPMEESGATTLLGEETPTAFSVEYEIIYIHTQEIIEMEAHV